MTAQIPDEFRYEGELYSIVGMKGEGLYTPEDFGMQPYSTCTACWRGHVMKYDCIDGKLLLVGMDINTKDAKTISGIEPISKGAHFFEYSYVDIGLKTKFTGSMLLARDFIDSMYVHMGFQRPWAYETVIELQVETGDIISVSDLSEKMEEIRVLERDKGAQPKTRSNEDVKDWISETFSLDYDL